jgi:hypothetical protein
MAVVRAANLVDGIDHSEENPVRPVLSGRLVKELGHGGEHECLD